MADATKPVPGADPVVPGATGTPAPTDATVVPPTPGGETPPGAGVPPTPGGETPPGAGVPGTETPDPATPTT